MKKRYSKLEIDLVLNDYLKRGILRMEEKNGERIFYITDLINKEMKKAFPKTWWYYFAVKWVKNLLNNISQISQK